MGYFQIDNWLFDEVMPEADPYTFKVVAAVVRKTDGWHRETDAISISQFQKMIGTSSRSTATKAIQDALDCGWIDRKRDGQGYRYWTTTSPESGPPSPNNGPESSPESVPVSSPESGHTKEQREITNKNTQKGHPVWELPEPLDTDNFEEAWILWYRHKEDVKDPLTQTSGEMLLQELADMGEQRAIVAIRHSVARGWKNVYEPSQNGHGQKSEYAEEVTDESGGYNI